MKSVKLLCDNAKQLVEQELHKWRQFAQGIGDVTANTTANNMMHEIQTILSRTDYWKKDPVEALNFTAPNWLMYGLFRKEIKGAIVICYNSFFEVRGLYSKEEAKLLVEKKVRKLRGEVEFLTFRKSTPPNSSTYERMPIPEDVRSEVWRRDQGKCVRCGSVRNLEFDHLVPVAKGGSNTARNIQLLCEACNRQKSDNI